MASVLFSTHGWKGWPKITSRIYQREGFLHRLAYDFRSAPRRFIRTQSQQQKGPKHAHVHSLYTYQIHVHTHTHIYIYRYVYGTHIQLHIHTQYILYIVFGGPFCGSDFDACTTSCPETIRQTEARWTENLWEIWRFVRINQSPYRGSEIKSEDFFVALTAAFSMSGETSRHQSKKAAQ